MNEHPIEGLMNTAMSNLKDMIDVNTVIGNMSDINASNKFYAGIKQLVLRR